MKLKAAVAQFQTIQNDIEANLQKGESYIAKAAKAGAELVVLPELWTTALNWENMASMYNDQQPTIQRVADMAKRYNIWISSTMLTSNNENKPSNTAFVFDNKGECKATYAKTHLATVMNEQKYIQPGNKLQMLDTPWGKAGLVICYEVRFPEIWLHYALNGAKFIIFSTAFPEPRLKQLHILLKARALENQMFVLASNQVGASLPSDKNSPRSCGGSCIIDPLGELISKTDDKSEQLLVETIDLAQVDETRQQFPTLSERRTTLYK